MTNLDSAYANLPTPKPKRPPANTFKSRARLLMLKWAGRKYRRRNDSSAGKLDKILLIRPDHLGDLLYLTPALRHLRSLLPEAHITLLLGPWGKAAMQNNPHLDELLLCEFPGFTRQAKPSPRQPYQYLKAQAESLRSQEFDVAVILRFDHWWGAWLAAEAGIPRRYGFDIASVKPFLTDAIPYKDQRHEVEQNWRLAHFAWSRGILPVVESWSEPDIIGPTEFFFSPEDKAWAIEWLNSHNLTANAPLVIIHPGAGADVKHWRVSAWAQAAQRLIQDRNCQIILSGGPDEVALCQEIAAHITPKPVISAGETSLGQLAALLSRADLVIGPDTGPLKLAGAVGTPSLQLYGPVDAVKFGPWGNPASQRYITSGLSCIPCNQLDYAHSELEAHYCVRGLSLEKVLETALEMLK